MPREVMQAGGRERYRAAMSKNVVASRTKIVYNGCIEWYRYYRVNEKFWWQTRKAAGFGMEISEKQTFYQGVSLDYTGNTSCDSGRVFF